MTDSLLKKLVLILSGLILILVVAVGYLIKSQRDAINDYSALQIAMNNSIKQFKDKDGNVVTQTEAANFATTGALANAVKLLNTQGDNILSKVDNQTQGLILLNKTVGGLIKGKTTVVAIDTVTDTLKSKAGKDSAIAKEVWPTYRLKDSTKFYKIDGTVGKEGFAVTPLFKDTSELKPTMLRQGLFKPSILGIQEINHNPYSSTYGLKYLQVKKSIAPIWKILGISSIFIGGIYVGHKL